MTQLRNQGGFTIIELMLSMTFVGALLVAIAMTTINIMNTYNKGVTIREVNQVGRLITEDIQRTIASSPPFNVAPKTGLASDPVDSKYVVQGGGGRLCTGTYTYAWNYGATKELSGNDSKPAVYNTYQDSSNVIRLVKVVDTGGYLCTHMSEQISRERSKELLPDGQPLASGGISDGGDRNIAVQQFAISEGTRDDASSQALYAIDLTLGTNDQDQINPITTTCLPPKEGSGSEEFCAINQFSIIARAGNRSGSLQ